MKRRTLGLLTLLTLPFSSFAAKCPEPEYVNQHFQFVGNNVFVRNVKDIGIMRSIGTSPIHSVHYESFSSMELRLQRVLACTYKGTGSANFLTLQSITPNWRPGNIGVWTGRFCTRSIDECIAINNPRS